MFGYNINEIPNGKEWFKRAFPDDEKRRDAVLTWKNDFKDASPGEKRPRTYEVYCKNGESKIVDFVPVLLENNEYLMTVDDITERQIAENALKQSEERFRTVASSAVDAIIITDLEGRIVFCNDSLQRIFGYPRTRYSWRISGHTYSWTLQRRVRKKTGKIQVNR